jgi:hypothetical protein
MMGYLFPIIGETSFALRLPDGVIILFADGVEEKARAGACRVEAAKRRSPEDNILEAAAISRE